MTSASVLYELFLDLDFQDYSETREKDLAFIETLINEIGYRNAKAVLQEMTA